MGESSSSDSGGSSNLESLRQRDKAMAEATNRAKEQQEAKSRESAFNQYNRMQSPSPEGGAAQLPSKATMDIVSENIGLAQDLERKASKSQLNVPVPTVGSVALNTISSINYRNQARALRAGGRPVYSSVDNSYQGVVQDGRYSGNPDFSPIGRSDGVTRTSSGSYQTTQMESGGSDSSAPTETVVAPKPVDVTSSSPSLSTASRRALIAGAGGGAARRNLL